MRAPAGSALSFNQILTQFGSSEGTFVRGITISSLHFALHRSVQNAQNAPARSLPVALIIHFASQPCQRFPSHWPLHTHTPKQRSPIGRRPRDYLPWVVDALPVRVRYGLTDACVYATKSPQRIHYRVLRPYTSECTCVCVCCAVK